MKREFVYIKDIELYGKAHLEKDDGSFLVDNSIDPKTYEEHIEGIEYIKKLLIDGVKIMPVLLMRVGTMYINMDGFKRIKAHIEYGAKIIEAFVFEEHELNKEYEYDNKIIYCRRGGQNFRVFTSPVEYGECDKQEKGHGNVNYLYIGKHVRIEYRENIHIHWGDKGLNRFAMGKRDFNILMEMFLSWEK